MFVSVLKKLFHKSKANPVSTPISEFGWFGDFSSWEEVKQISDGYDASIIIDKVQDSIIKVKNGAAVYERDSVLFDKVEYSWPLLTSLLWIVSQKKTSKLNVLDFGGSLGSTYFQNRKFLNSIESLKWNIVEQKNFVDRGNKFIKDEVINFYESIEECTKVNKIDVIIFSGVLQCIPEPYKILKQAFNENFQYILIDITGFSYNDKDRITIEKVWPEVYDASYPCWFFSETKFLDFFSEDYELIEDFKGYVGEVIPIDGIPQAGYKGFLFKKRSSL